MAMSRIQIQTAAFDAGALLNGFIADQDNAGATVSFTGIVRDRDAGDMSVMEIEHYPGMTERAIETIRAEAIDRWGLSDALVVHRHGRLARGEPIMMVATAARHRVAAFEAAEFLMDYLKSRAPFWKKEIGPDGADWVAAKDDDEAALGRWQDKT